MHLSLITLLIILGVLVVLSGFFSASEIGFMSLNRYRLSYLATKKHRQAMRVLHMLEHPEKLLSIVLIGNTIANIIASSIATIVGQQLGGELGIAVATLLLTLVVLVFSELVPKTLAALHPQNTAFAISLPLKWLGILLTPFVNSLSYLAHQFLKIVGVKIQKNQKELLTTEEIRTILTEAGVFSRAEHKNMLVKLLDLEQLAIEEIMIPKADIFGLDITQPWHELLDQLKTAKHTRLPLYEETIEHLIGIVHVRDLLNLALDEALNYESLLASAEKPYFIPEGTLLNVQLLNFQKEKQRSCFVVDEYGDLLGLATIEDIFEEVVGEFTTDIAALSKDIIPQSDHSFIIEASITLRQLRRLLNWQLPELGPRTLSGLIIEYLGYIPPSECCLRIERFQIEILRISENRVKTVRMIEMKRDN